MNYVNTLSRCADPNFLQWYTVYRGTSSTQHVSCNPHGYVYYLYAYSLVSSGRVHIVALGYALGLVFEELKGWDRWEDLKNRILGQR